MKFRMVDRIVAFDPCRRIRAAKTVSFEEYRLKSAFGAWPCLPESLVLESLFQAGVWLIMISSDFTQTGLVVRIQEARFVEPVGPGDVLSLEVEARRYRADGVLFDGRAQVNGKIVAHGKGCLAAVAQLGEYFDAEDLRVWFSQIYRPDGGGWD